MASDRPEDIEPTFDEIRRVATAICKSRTCEGMSCCQWPAQGGRTHCPVAQGGYDDAAREAIRAMLAARPSPPPVEVEERPGYREYAALSLVKRRSSN